MVVTVSVSCSSALHHVAWLCEVTSGVFTPSTCWSPPVHFSKYPSYLCSSTSEDQRATRSEWSGLQQGAHLVQHRHPSWDDHNKDLSTRLAVWRPGIVRNKLGEMRWMVLEGKWCDRLLIFSLAFSIGADNQKSSSLFQLRRECWEKLKGNVFEFIAIKNMKMFSIYKLNIYMYIFTQLQVIGIMCKVMNSGVLFFYHSSKFVLLL